MDSQCSGAGELCKAGGKSKIFLQLCIIFILKVLLYTSVLTREKTRKNTPKWHAFNSDDSQVEGLQNFFYFPDFFIFTNVEQ